MKSRPITILGALIFCLSASPLLAQPATRPAQGAGRGEALIQRVRGLMGELNLSDEQKAKIEDVFKSAKEDMQQMAGELQNMGQQERAQRVREFMQGLREKISVELNDDQKKLLAEKIQQMRQQFGAGGAAPATQPGNAQPGEQRPMALLKRLEDSVQQLGLSDDQKGQIKTILGDIRTKLQELRGKAQGDAMQLRDGARQIFADAREQLMGVLSPAQQQKLREMMQDAAQQPGDRARGRANPNSPDAPKMMDPDKPAGDKPADEPAAEKDQPHASAAPAPPRVAVGQSAPDFNLLKLDGRNVQLSSFKGKILVLVFGSYSSPSFRQRAAQVQELSRETGSKASYLIIYTKEAHPKDGWQVERNRDEKIEVSAHKDQAARIARAKEARESLKLSLPIAVDDMNDSVATAYGAGENSAFVIGRDGTILASQNWCDPYGLRRIIDQAAETKPGAAQAENR